MGASFLAPFEAARAVREGYASQLLWGSDYPHIEGTWQYAVDDDAEPVTRAAQRNTFCAIPAAATRAEKIAAPTLADLSVPIESVPAGASPTAFRTFGAWK